MHITWMPQTQLGRWSLYLVGAAAALIMFTSLITVGLFHQSGGNTVFDNLFVSIPMVTALVAASVAFVTALISLWGQRERSVLLAIPILVGVFLVVLFIGELGSPH